MNDKAASAKESTRDENARTLLNTLIEETFSSDIKQAAIALGRDEEQIQKVLNGAEEIDDDLEMKIRGLLQEREPAMNEKLKDTD
jgi:plasmid maintenance system antidote protein VapI